MPAPAAPSYPTGLTEAEAQALLDRYGPNELPTSRPKTILRIALEVLKEPLFLLLIACGILYGLLGEYQDTVFLMIAILLIIGITFFQHRRSERALEALRDLSSPRALVLRDGERRRIPGKQVVPGDVVVLSEGDRVPADGEVLMTEGMLVDESMLTGESVPVHKRPADGTGSTPDEHQRVFSGTLLTQGHGLVRITATGTGTRMGGIGRVMQGITDKDTRLQVEMKRLIRRLGLIGIGICVLVVLVFVITRGSWIKALLAGLSSAIAILPEEFPMVLTIFLALGAWRLSRRKVLTRHPSAIETLGSATVLCVDKTGTLTRNRMQVVTATDGAGREIALADTDLYDIIDGTLGHAYLSSPDSPFDPMEVAIREAHGPHAERGGWTGRDLVREHPFSSGALMTTRVHRRSDRVLLTASAKGAPEAILALCTLDPEAAQRIRSVINAMADRGLRVIAVASAEVAEAAPPGHQKDYPFRFEGLIGLEDPLRPEVPEAMRQCRSAGVRVIMMTGDHPATARAIGERIGLVGGLRTITGAELDAMDDATLRLAVRDAGIFARLVPEQKLRLVNALRADGEVVAMTGDGVNDAPALRAADIGIAMGLKGTDVAREAASLVLLDDDFASIVGAIRLGRRIYDNLQKAMDFILAVHIPFVGMTLLPAFVPSLPLLFLPMEIVFLEMIIDPICTIAFEGHPEERDIMDRPPRSINARFFGPSAMLFSLLKGILALITVIIVYFLSIREGHTEQEVRSIAFAAVFLVNTALIISGLSARDHVLRAFLRSTNAAKGIIALSLVLFMLILTLPVFERVFNIANAGAVHYLPSITGALLLIVVLELLRRTGWRRWSAGIIDRRG